MRKKQLLELFLPIIASNVASVLKTIGFLAIAIFNLFFSVLLQKESFLLFNLVTQLLFSRHIGHVLCCIELVVVVKNRVSGNSAIGIST